MRRLEKVFIAFRTKLDGQFGWCFSWKGLEKEKVEEINAELLAVCETPKEAMTAATRFKKERDEEMIKNGAIVVSGAGRYECAQGHGLYRQAGELMYPNCTCGRPLFLAKYSGRPVAAARGGA